MKSSEISQSSGTLPVTAVRQIVRQEIVSFEDRLLDYLGDNFADLGMAFNQRPVNRLDTNIRYPWEVTDARPTTDTQR